jgi:hypothetical protein
MKIDADGLDEHARVLLARGVLSASNASERTSTAYAHARTNPSHASGQRSASTDPPHSRIVKTNTK